MLVEILLWFMFSSHLCLKAKHLSAFTFDKWVTTAVFVPAFALTAALLIPRLAIAFSISLTSLCDWRARDVSKRS